MSTDGLAQDRLDIFIHPGTTVSLIDLFPVSMNKSSKPTLNVQEFHVGSEAKIVIQSPISLNAKKIGLEPNSRVLTVGNSLHIKSDEFLAVSPNGFAIIDTRSLESATSGSDATRIPEPSPNCNYNQGVNVKQASVGYSGLSGGDGRHGAAAGSLTIVTQKFLGGNFILTDGDGGHGGFGGVGGMGGRGLNESNQFGHMSFNDWPCGMYVHPNLGELMTGGQGGDGGAGGRGGQGGHGGNLTISCEEFRAASEENFRANVSGGRGGSSGNPGPGGAGGEGGTVMREMTRQLEQGHTGSMGPMGSIGISGVSGDDGKIQIINGMNYEIEE